LIHQAKIYIDRSRIPDYYLVGRATRGASGALNPQSALAGWKPSFEALRLVMWFRRFSDEGRVLRDGALRTGSDLDRSSPKGSAPGAVGVPNLS